MRVFVLLSRVPWPLEKGDKLRAYHQLKAMAQAHEVHVCCLSHRAIRAEALQELRSITPHINLVRLNPLLTLLQLLWATLSSKPYQVHYFYQWNAARRIKRVIEEIKPDCIFAQLVRTAEYVKEFHHIPKALDYMDALSAGLQRRADASPWWMRWIIQSEQRRMAAYEHTIFEYFERHFIISKQDQQCIRHPRNSSITILANGVDTTYFAPRTSDAPLVDVLFTGNMGYMPNIMAAERLVTRIIPLVRRVFPDVSVLIAGAEPAARVQGLVNKNVAVTGWVEDIREAYQQARIFIAPMEIGSGMQNKLLEAMSMGVPCITSPIAARAFQHVPNLPCLVAETDEEIAAHCIAWMQDASRREQMAAQARSFVVDHCSWNAANQPLIDFVGECVSN